MKVEEKIINRFNELISTANQLLQTMSVSRGYEINAEYKDVLYAEIDSETGYQKIPTITTKTVDKQSINQWGISCLHILKKVFGDDSAHYKLFNGILPWLKNDDNAERVQYAIGIMNAAKDDYEHGYLFDTRVLIEAEVFDDFLEQAEHLLKQNYYAPAAVIAGSVLEDGLRKLCQRNNITLPAKPKLDSMNSNLAKAGVYNLLMQKKITALADLRNKAAHGKWNEFNDKDVEDMIRDVRRFMENHFS